MSRRPKMSPPRTGGWLGALLSFAASAVLALGADPPEMDQAYQAALKSFQDGFHERAKKELADFVERFPGSTNAGQAILLQAQCLFALKQFKPVVELLAPRVSRAGALADSYRFWLAEAEFYDQHYEAAAKAYEELLTSSTNRSLRLQASYGEAWAYSKLGDLDRTIKLLSNSAGAFRQAAQKATNEDIIVQGYLLLGETYSKNKDYRNARQVLEQLATRNLTPESNWERLHLSALNALADQKPEEALQTALELVALASNTNRLNKPVLQANSLILVADIQRDKNPDAAIAAYEQITKLERIPSSQKQQALLRIIDLLVGQNRFTNAVARLQPLLTETNQDTPPDLVRLTMGELHLKQYYASTGTSSEDRSRTNLALTNLLFQARNQFEEVVKMTNSPLVAKAYLNRGWCVWEEALLTGATNKFAEGQAAFQIAAELLPASADQAVARFKLADCQFHQKDYTNAVRNYRLVIERYRDLAEVQTKWFDQAYYQMIRASLENDDLATAREGLNHLLEEFPTSEFTARSALNFAAELFGNGLPAEARAARDALLRFQKRAVGSPWLPEVQLAIARSYVIENNWTAAISEYDQWLAENTNHASRPQAVFDEALTYYRAGAETNALSLFTNLVVQFPTNHVARWARLWLGDYYFNQQNYTNAEYHYQLLWNNRTNAVSTELRYQAGLRAGKTALLRDRPSDARDYLTNLISALNIDTNRPPSIEVEAYFVLSDVVLKEVTAADSTNSLARFGRALAPLNKIITLYPTNRFEPIARARIADCNLQLASQDPARYDDAITNYFKAMTSPFADASTRCQAEVGLAIAQEKLAALKAPLEQKALLNEALNHCLNVALGKNTATDPHWVAQAGQQAAKLAEQMQLTEQAAKTIERLLRDFPQLRKLQPNLARRLQDLKNGGANQP